MAPEIDIYELAAGHVVGVITGGRLVTVTYDGSVLADGLYDGLVPVSELVGVPDVRRMAGVTQRETLIRWRREHGFPAPLEAERCWTELWDAREVRSWLKTVRPKIGSPKKSRRRR